MGDDMPMPKSGGYAIDWDNIDLDAMDPFATKTKVVSNFDTGASNPTPLRQDSDVECGEQPAKPNHPPVSPDENKAPAKNSSTSNPTKPKPTKSSTNKKSSAPRVPMRERLAAMRAKKLADKSQDGDGGFTVSISAPPNGASAEPTEPAAQTSPKPKPSQPVSLQDKIAEMRRKKKADADAQRQKAHEMAQDQTAPPPHSHLPQPGSPTHLGGGSSSLADSRKSSVERPPSDVTLPDSDASSMARSYKGQTSGTQRKQQQSNVAAVSAGTNLGVYSEQAALQQPSTPPKSGIAAHDESTFGTPSLKETELCSKMDDLSLVKEDASALLHDIVTPPVNSRAQSQLDRPARSPPLAQKVLTLNHQAQAQHSSSISASTADPLNAELLNFLVGSTSATQVDNEIYKNLRQREQEMSEQSVREATERAEIEEYYTQIKTRYDRIKTTTNNTNRRRQYTTIESELQRQKEQNFSHLKQHAENKQQYEEFKVGILYKFKQLQQELTLSKSREKLLQQKLKSSQEQIVGLQEQNEGLTKICEEMLETK